MLKSKILFQISGSIAAFKAASVVSELVKQGFDVKVVFSKSASKFVGASTFEGLTGHAVHSDVFDPKSPMAHIDLARWADLMVLCPASANSLAQLAHGFANDLVGTLFLAKEPHIPYLIFPAMNPQMWSAPSVRQNREALSRISGVQIIEPASGSMACGEVGEGRLPEPEEILRHIQRSILITGNNLGAVLITGGGTSEPMDSVRFITNFSTGRTSVGLAQHLNLKGYGVKLLLSQTAQAENLSGLNVTRFRTHGDLESALQRELSENNYRAVLHLAAVSDFTVKEVTDGKISSKLSELTLKLVPTKKIVASLREWSLNKSAKIIAFKLTANATKTERLQQARDIMEKNGLDAVVANDLSEVGENHSGHILVENETPMEFKTKIELYRALEELIEETV